jgi:hypothetical protein
MSKTEEIECYSPPILKLEKAAGRFCDIVAVQNELGYRECSGLKTSRIGSRGVNVVWKSVVGQLKGGGLKRQSCCEQL